MRPADNAPQFPQDALRDGGRSHGDAAHNSPVFSDPAAVDAQGGGNWNTHCALLNGGLILAKRI
jgi:hypothetical protein